MLDSDRTPDCTAHPFDVQPPAPERNEPIGRRHVSRQCELRDDTTSTESPAVGDGFDRLTS
ncbi:hypothetical protein [Streptomyces sp. DSM 15324]|uniref:hypothetical protein n=1 Tax=Streptomyces sp. DSM 15324 TaxID=1739111 RepID=UPI000749EBD4|nr:hypothetical protein [Streptomyces sp. DSM 15324]KUO09887.1 hypothetical protein AQJ58_22885 [Streptomyces sp. DSM 15324]